MVASGLRIACRRATWPTRRCPSSVNATTQGVVRPPSAFGMISARPPSIVAATAELVVPKSIPTALAIALLLPADVVLTQVVPIGSDDSANADVASSSGSDSHVGLHIWALRLANADRSQRRSGLYRPTLRTPETASYPLDGLLSVATARTVRRDNRFATDLCASRSAERSK